MKFINILVLIMLSACATVQAEDNYELGYQGHFNDGSNEVLDMLERLRNNPTAEIRIENGWTIINLKNDYSIWSFAPKTHPAYPSFAKRVPVKEADGIYLKTSITCGATKEICDSFVKDFIELNNKVKEHMNPQ